MNVDFTKGLFTNAKPINTPEGFYIDAENIRASGKSRLSEEGNIKLNIPDNIVQWGSCAVGDKTIVIGQLTGNSGENIGSIIGSLDKQDNWLSIIDRRLPDILGIVEPTQIEGRKDWRGDTLVYLTTSKGARRINLDTYNASSSDEEFDKTTKLFLEYDLPIATYTQELTTGEVPSGVYQVAARLLTDSGAATVFGIMSNVVSVVPPSLDSYRDNIDGAPPQTPTVKAIEFEISNIDTTFKWIEVAVLTYIGLANTPAVYLMSRILINGASSITITYRGVVDNKEPLTLEELIVSGVAYQTGEFLTQKDGTLLIGGPKEADMPPIDWNRVAQGIVADYTIKKIQYSEILKFEYDTDVDEKTQVINVKETSTRNSDQGYHNPITCALYKGYRREEIYSFTLTPIFKSGLQGPTVQIPAMHSVNTDATTGGSGSILATSADLTGLAPGSYGNWSVVAIAGTDTSDQSAILGVKLLGGPDAPLNFVFNSATTTQYTVSWDAAVPDTNGSVISEYWVFVTLNNTDQIVGKVIGSPPLLTFTGDVTYPGIGYTADYYVEAVDSNGFHSARSNTASVTVPGTASAVVPPVAVAAVVNPPTNLVATNIGETSFRLTWDASTSPGVITYWVYLGQYVYSIVGSAGTSTGGQLGTFISEEVYDDRYPDILEGSGIRLHRFPTVIQEPIIEGDARNGDLYIRVLGVNFSNIRLNVSEEQYSDQIAGIIIGRVNRKGQETQLSQGIVRPTCFVKIKDDSTTIKSILLGDGTVSWENFGDKEGSTVNDFEYDSAAAIWNSVHFIAPDIIHGLYSVFQGNYIQQNSLYKCSPFLMKNEYDVSVAPGREDAAKPSTYFKNIEAPYEVPLDRTRIQLDGSPRLIGPFGVPLMNGARGGKVNVSITLTGDAIEMCSSDGFAWIKTLNDTAIPNYVTDVFGTPIFLNTYRKWVDEQYTQTVRGYEKWEFTSGIEADPDIPFVLYSMTRDNPKQYGALDQMVGMFVVYSEWQNSVSNEVSFFNGDTFINKYGLTINDEAYYPFGDNDDIANPHQAIGFTKPSNASCIVNMWLESSNNYAYRHYIEPTTFSVQDIDNTQGTTPYYPKYKQLVNNKTPLGILAMAAENWTRAGYASQYNNQYSAQPTIVPYPVTPPEDIEENAFLVNRIIYSDTVVQGEKNDAYQIFLPNNYYDVPQEYGELTSIYVNRELFASTNQIQWKLFYNTLVTQATSAGTVVLGSGGAFNRPAVPMQTVDGGHGGTSHWIHAENTIYGRVFVDKLQGRIFLLTDQLKDISLTLDDQSRVKVQEIPDYDILIGSEALYDRAFIRIGDEMLTYDFLRSNFISRHTYIPRWLFSHSSYMYSNNTDSSDSKSTGIFKHGIGTTGIFYDKLHGSNITAVMNIGSDESKLFRTISLISTMKTEQGLNLPFDTFNQIQIWNDERNSGLIDIIPKTNTFQVEGIMQVLQSKVRDNYRLVVPRDIVLDPSKDIFDSSNHAQVRGDTISALWLPKIRGNFIHIKLITDNTKGPIQLFRIGVEVSKNVR